MEPKTPNSISIIFVKKDLTAAAIPFLLNSYKHGIFDLGEVFTQKSFFDDIQKHNYAVVYKDKVENKEMAVMQLTQKGANFIENNFLEILTGMSPYYTFPLIRSGDKVNLVENVENKYDENGRLVKKLINSPSGSRFLEKGTYQVQSCDASSILITDDCFVAYRLRLPEFKDRLKLCTDTLKLESVELKERVGTIRVRTLVERLHEKMPTLKLAELVDTLYEMPHTKDRLTDE
jgi:hypothetical protein